MRPAFTNFVFFNKFFLYGLLIRILIMPFFAHPDIFWINSGPSNITNNVFNIYEFHGDNKNIHLFKYPPLAYFFLAAQHIIFKPFISDFDFFKDDIHSYNYWFDSPNIFQNLFVLKIFYLLADIFILFFCLKISDDNDNIKKNIIKFWAFSPFVFYATYMYAQFDILPTAFVFLAFYFFYKARLCSAFFCLGIASALKHFPFILLPFFLILIDRPLKYRLLYFLLCLLPYLIFLPFYISSPSFLDDVIFNSSSYITKSKIFMFGYFIILALCLFFKRNRQNINILISYSFIVLSLYLISVREFNPQFILWITPFFYLFAAKNKIAKYLYFLLIPVYFIYITYLGVNSTNKILIPLNNDLTALPSINSIISHIFKINYDKIIFISKWLFNFLLLIFFFIKVDVNENN